MENQGVNKYKVRAFLFMLIIALLGGLLSAFVFKNFEETAEEMSIESQLESLVKKDPAYLDVDLILGADTNHKVFSVVKTEDDNYVLLQVVSARLEKRKAVSEITLRFPNGELYVGGLDSYFTDLILRDGTKTQAQLIIPALSLIELDNGSVVPIEIYNGEIKNGRLAGIFSARAVNSGYQLAGLVEIGKIVKGYMNINPTYVPPTVRIFGYLVVYEETSDLSDEQVLAARTGEGGGISGDQLEDQDRGISEDNKPNYGQAVSSRVESPGAFNVEGAVVRPNYEKGTYMVSGVDGGQAVSLRLIRDIVGDSLGSQPEFTYSGLDRLITSEDILDLTIQDVDIADGAVTEAKIQDGAVTSLKIADGAIGTSGLADASITSSKIADSTITASKLSSQLTFSGKSFIDLSAITHNSSAPQGLRLPNVTGATPVSPSTGEGYIAWDALGNQLIVYDGTTWVELGGSTSLYTGSDTTTTTSSVSGLEIIGSDELSLVRGCSDGYVLKWNGTTNVWECSEDVGAAGGGITTIQEDNVTVLSGATIIDFTGNDFSVTNAGGGRGLIAIDYTNSGITRSNQTQTISGAWTFSDISISDTDIPFSGGSTTFDLLGGSTTALTIINSTAGQVANLNLSDGGLYTGGTLRLSNSGALSNITGLSISSGTVSLPAESISNAELANSSVTINTGSGLSGGGTVSLGGSLSLANEGVLSLTGTANQVLVNGTSGSAQTGALTLTLPQNIHTGATPAFSALTLSNTTNQIVLGTTNTTTITSVAPASSRTATIPALSANDEFLFAAQTQTLTGKTIAAGSNTISGLTTTNFTSANVSQWTNDAGYLTSVSGQSIGDLSDVVITTASDGQLLRYVSSQSRWENFTPSYITGVVWGDITGTLSNQTDLQTALGTKQDTGNYITALTGDVTASGPGSVAATIANQAVTYAKIQNVTANRLLGRVSTDGSIQEITLGTNLSFDGTTLNAAGAGATSFADVTAGTNTAALVVGTGGSLSTSGTGTIAATSLTCTGCIGDTQLEYDTGQNLTTSSTPAFSALTLSNTTNQIVLGTTNTTTITSVAPASSRTATIPALSANDEFLFAAQTQTLTGKTIAAGSNTISGLTTTNFTSANVSQWTNDAGYLTSVSGQSIGDLSDVVITTASDGQLLRYVSSQSRWENFTPSYITGVVWGDITGTLSNQTDLQTALGTKQDTGNYITALTGDVTASGPGSVAATIANQAVTYAKIQNVTANRLLGRVSTDGSIQEITLGTNLSFDGTTLNAAGAGATSFADVTAGTNTAALVVGTGGSLSTSGTGSITATALTCTGCIDDTQLEYDTGQNLTTSSTPAFSALTLSNTTNQIVLGTTNTTTITSVAPASSRTATIPALSANDEFLFAAQTQTLTGKTIAAGSNTISGLTTTNFTSANVSQWTNDAGYLTSVSGQSIGDLSDVVITTASDGQLLRYVSSQSRWENFTPSYITGVVWGDITGTLSNQTDLQTALGTKQDTGNYITALTGDVTASGPGSVAATIANQAVTYAKIQNVTANRLLGRVSTDGSIQEITLGTNLSFDGTTLNAAGAGATSFADVTAGTNTAALVVGTGGSLSTSGTGTIAATSLTCTGCIGDTQLEYDTGQNLTTSSTPAFSALTLSNTTNQIVLGTTNTTTITSVAPASSRTATIPALSANDEFLFAAQTQTLTGKTIAAGSNTISGLTTTNFTSANVSQWTNDAGYLTSVSGQSIGDLSDVVITTASDGQLLRYVSSQSRWENFTPSYITGVVWGDITGTLSNQTDLQTALGTKQDTGNYITALTGDVTASGPGSVAATIANQAVTYAKIQNVTANRLLGRVSTDGSIQEITLGTNLSFDGTTLNAAGAGATSFADVTAGTNTAALVVGTGGSLSTSGTGSITATALTCTGCIGDTQLEYDTGQNLTTSSTPAFSALTLSNTTNQIVLGTTNTTTIIIRRPAAGRTATIPALSANDEFLFAAQTQTLTGKTIAAGSNTISGLTTTNFTSANVSQWTNDAGYLTSVSGQSIGDLSDVVITTASDGQLLRYVSSQSRWENFTPSYITGVVWGDITGTLSNQTDLQTALGTKQDTGNYITALTGDVTASGPGSVAATIANQAVTYAKIQNVTANRLLGRVSTDGSIQEITLGTNLSFDGTTLNAAGAGATSFADVTAGTNTAALVVGTGGSLSTSGTGTIAATSLTCTGCIGDTQLEYDTGQNLTTSSTPAFSALTLSNTTNQIVLGTTNTTTIIIRRPGIVKNGNHTGSLRQ
jgi:trimeric autotransporter adhesin